MSESFSEFGLGNLQSDIPVQVRIASLPRLSHATRANGEDDMVRAESWAGPQAHGCAGLLQCIHAGLGTGDVPLVVTVGGVQTPPNNVVISFQ